MAERLKLISKGIHWSLLVKSALVAAAWAILPEWTAWALGGFFYFSSLFRVRHMGLPLLSAFLLVHFLGTGFRAALILGGLFYLILGLKELVFINRRSVSTLMIFSIILIAGFLLYGSLDTWSSWMPVKTLIFAWLFWALTRGFMLQIEEPHDKYPLALAVMAFLLWEIGTAAAFLPLDFVYQTTIVVFAAFIFFEWLIAYAESRLSRNKILLYLSFFFILITLIFSFAKWGI